MNSFAVMECRGLHHAPPAHAESNSKSLIYKDVKLTLTALEWPRICTSHSAIGESTSVSGDYDFASSKVPLNAFFRSLNRHRSGCSEHLQFFFDLQLF